ncbi:hypothetical protein BC332_33559 [Capsicum chinense]|nr:hypothetical protein BC332_33559 [Capsicum chinense]
MPSYSSRPGTCPNDRAYSSRPGTCPNDRVCSHLNPSQKIKVGRRCTPQRDPTNQIPCALWVYSTIYPHTSQTPWSVFQDELNGKPTGQRSKCTVVDLGSRLEHLRAVGFGCPNARWAVVVTAKRVELELPLDVTSIDADSYLGQPHARGQHPKCADVEAHQRHALPGTIEETAFHERTKSLGFGFPQSMLVHTLSRTTNQLISVPHPTGAYHRLPSASLLIISSTL